MPRSYSASNVFQIRASVLALAKALVFGVASAAPVALQPRADHGEAPGESGGPIWVLYIAAIILVLTGGAFAGLTIALMGQDEIYLQVISLDAEEPQRKNAKRVFDLLKRGKHWILVTLLLSNVIVNESLPIVLDRCFGGGIAAVVGSTVLIVIFGEVVPQSVCVRYGLQIGGYMSKPVLLLMYIMAPVAWPTAKLLDWLLGEDHGTVYKKSGLKTLVTLHKSLGEVDERLNQDEVTIISAVLDLKRKAVDAVMTPMKDVYTMSEDKVLDEETIDQILLAGYSRIPIYEDRNPTNYIGMLLVKILITYDPEDCKKVKDFPLATLPETRPETSCLDIINFFQEGKSHMVLISEFPGDDHGAMGVVTLEDVIEELIGEEIIDESDVYVDVHKAIRRSHPAPKFRIQRNLRRDSLLAGAGAEGEGNNTGRKSSLSTVKRDSVNMSTSPRMTTLMMRRSSAGQDGSVVHTTVPVQANQEVMKEAMKTVGPSNPASNPKTTRVSAVKIKPGPAQNRSEAAAAEAAAAEAVLEEEPFTEADEYTSLLSGNGKDGIQALHQNYSTGPSDMPSDEQKRELGVKTDMRKEASTEERSPADSSSSATTGNTQSRRVRGYARSGSITENIVEGAGGIRKVVLEMSSDSDGESAHSQSSSIAGGSALAEQGAQSSNKNRRKKRNNRG